MRIKDIGFDNDFWHSDYDELPQCIKEKLDRLIDIILEQHDLPNSCEAHQVHGMAGNIWTGYLTKGGQGWRMLYEVDVCGTMWIHRVMTHNKRDILLRNLLT